MLHNVYVFCLSVGVIYSVFSVVFHFISAAVDFGFELDLGFESHIDIFLPIRPFTVMVFLTVFGGAGLITEGYGHILSAVLSFVIGYVTAVLLYRGVYGALMRAQTETKGIRAAVGAEATILESIPFSGLGRISYVIDDNILSGVAKRLNAYEDMPSGDGVVYNNNGGETVVIDERFRKGETVYIWEVKDGIYFVAKEPLNREHRGRRGGQY